MKPDNYIQIKLRDGTMHDVSNDDVARWKQTYQQIDVEQQLRQYEAWSNANPAKRKTKRGINKSINFWLNSAQNQSVGISAFAKSTTRDNRDNFTVEAANRQSTDDDTGYDTRMPRLVGL